MVLYKITRMHVAQVLIGQYPCLDQAIRTGEFKSTFLIYFIKQLPIGFRVWMG